MRRVCSDTETPSSGFVYIALIATLLCICACLASLWLLYQSDYSVYCGVNVIKLFFVNDAPAKYRRLFNIMDGISVMKFRYVVTKK